MDRYDIFVPDTTRQPRTTAGVIRMFTDLAHAYVGTLQLEDHATLDDVVRPGTVFVGDDGRVLIGEALDLVVSVREDVTRVSAGCEVREIEDLFTCLGFPALAEHYRDRIADGIAEVTIVPEDETLVHQILRTAIGPAFTATPKAVGQAYTIPLTCREAVRTLVEAYRHIGRARRDAGGDPDAMVPTLKGLFRSIS